MRESRPCPQCRSDVEADETACPFCDAVLKEAPQPRDGSRKLGRRPVLGPCPDCGGTVSDRAASCPHCGCPLQGRSRQARPAGVLVSLLIGTFAVSGLFNMLTSGLREAKARPSPPRVEAGARAVLTSKGGDGAFVAFDLKSWSRMLHAQARRDAGEMARLTDVGEIALVANSTPLLVLDSGTMMLQVRILAGPYASRQACVRKEFVRAVRL